HSTHTSVDSASHARKERWSTLLSLHRSHTGSTRSLLPSPRPYSPPALPVLAPSPSQAAPAGSSRRSSTLVAIPTAAPTLPPRHPPPTSASAPALNSRASPPLLPTAPATHLHPAGTTPPAARSSPPPPASRRCHRPTDQNSTTRGQTPGLL